MLSIKLLSCLFSLLILSQAASSEATTSQYWRTYFSTDDYPKEALRNHWEGSVVVEVRVDTAGRARDCRVVKSSGYEVLDDKTCELLKARLRYIPAKDELGHPVESIVQSPPITWRLPTLSAPPTGPSTLTYFTVDDYPAAALQNGWQGAVVPELTVDARGKVKDCRIVQSSGYQLLDDKTCEILKSRARFTPAKDQSGDPVEGVVRSPPITWRLAG